MARDLRAFFAQQGDEIASRIEQFQSLDIEAVYHPREHDAALKAVIGPHLLRAATAGAEFEESLLNEKAAKLFDKVAAKIRQGVSRILGSPIVAKINDTTQAIAQGVIDAAKKAGASIAETAKKVRDAFSGSAARALDAARTETTGALNMGAHAVREYYAEAGRVVSKIWAGMLDDRERQSHVDMEGATVGQSEPFYVNGHPAQYPGDISLPAGERCGCRCWTISVTG